MKDKKDYNKTAREDKHKCPTCGCSVRVEGKTTQYYVSTVEEENRKLKQAIKDFELPKRPHNKKFAFDRGYKTAIDEIQKLVDKLKENV